VSKVTGALLLAGAVLVATAVAAVRPTPTGFLQYGSGAVSPAEQSRVEAYWTAGRMHSAARPSPGDTATTSRSGTRAGVGAAGGGGGGRSEVGRIGPLIGALSGLGDGGAAPLQPLRPVRPAAPRAVVQAEPWGGSGAVSRAVGRVFFTLGRHDFSCSGTAVHSRNRDTVITAGHCVNAGPGPYVRNWVFVPGYHAGARPYGTWTARRLAAPAGWVRAGQAADDVGFAVLNLRRGRHLAAVVGGLPIRFDTGPETYIWVFGFPGAQPYGGRRSTYCRGTDRADPYGTSALGLACTMTAGSSGGPWLAGFAGGTGTICSVTSFSYRGVPDLIWGPRLGRTAARLYAAAQRW
jgi:V8-like Glu-specific endopeptidase